MLSMPITDRSYTATATVRWLAYEQAIATLARALNSRTLQLLSTSAALASLDVPWSIRPPATTIVYSLTAQ